MADATTITDSPRVQSTDILRVDRLTAGYSGRPVIFDIDLTVRRGEVVVLLGANGAGKTTTLRAITGSITPSSGSVEYDLAPWRLGRPWAAASAGIAVIPAEQFTFADLSVRENLELGGYSLPGSLRSERVEEMFTAYPLLGERRRQLAGTMSGGQQRLLSLAMAMMTEPRLLLLDELSLGLAPVIAEELFERVGEMVTRRGMSVLMVEQNVGQALRISDRAYVIRAGRILLEEDADALRERESWWDLF